MEALISRAGSTAVEQRIGGAGRRVPRSTLSELLDLSSPPASLYAIGLVSALTKPRVAIVGTRNSTGYGERTARSLTRALVRAGVSVISGMARGIDAAAHRTAIEEGGNTVAVLGTGIDVPYPVGHRQLHRSIGEHGLVLSEKLRPGPLACGGLPKRNRIIAALAPVTIVVERWVQERGAQYGQPGFGTRTYCRGGSGAD